MLHMPKIESTTKMSIYKTKVQDLLQDKYGKYQTTTILSLVGYLKLPWQVWCCCQTL